MLRGKSPSLVDQQLIEMGVQHCGSGCYSAMFKLVGISDSYGDGGGALTNADIPKDNSVSYLAIH